MYACMYVYRTLLCMYLYSVYVGLHCMCCMCETFTVYVCMYVRTCKDCKNTNYSVSVYPERLYVCTNIDSYVNSCAIQTLQVFIHIRRVIIGVCTARAALKSLILLPVVAFTCSVRFTARSKNAATWSKSSSVKPLRNSMYVCVYVRVQVCMYVYLDLCILFVCMHVTILLTSV